MSHSSSAAHHLKNRQSSLAAHHKKHGGHGFALGVELGAWLPIAAVIFLTAGTVAVFALVSTGSSSNLLAQAAPYDCWFASNGNVGCNGSSCAECVNGSAVSMPAVACSGLSACGPSTPPPVFTSTPVPSVIQTSITVSTPSPTNKATSTVIIPTSTPSKAPVGVVVVPPTLTPKPAAAVPVPATMYSFGNLPVDSALKIFSGKPNGSQCQQNRECESKHCVANDYGNYCGSDEPQCKSGQTHCVVKNGGNVAQSCNNNGYWQTKEVCQGGCQQGACTKTLCTPNQASCDQNNRKICSGDGMSWRYESCSNNTICKDGSCTSDSIPVCTDSNSCTTTGSYCTNDKQQKFVCVDSKWQQLFNGQKVSVVGCNQQKAGLYLAGLNDAADLIQGVTNLVIDCAAQTSIFNISSTTTLNACQLDANTTSGSVRFLCNSSASISTIAHSARHEAAKVWAMQHGFAGAVVPAYSEAVGCRRQNTVAGVRYTFSKEQPTSSLGRKDCAEAFAEAVAMYLEEPCRMKEVFPIQYRWMSSMESPFKGAQRCES